MQKSPVIAYATKQELTKAYNLNPNKRKTTPNYNPRVASQYKPLLDLAYKNLSKDVTHPIVVSAKSLGVGALTLHIQLNEALRFLVDHEEDPAGPFHILRDSVVMTKVMDGVAIRLKTGMLMPKSVEATNMDHDGSLDKREWKGRVMKFIENPSGLSLDITPVVLEEMDLQWLENVIRVIPGLKYSYETPSLILTITE